MRRPKKDLCDFFKLHVYAMPEPSPVNNLCRCPVVIPRITSLSCRVMSVSSQEPNECLGENCPLQLERREHDEKKTGSALESKDNSSEPAGLPHSTVDDWRGSHSL